MNSNSRTKKKLLLHSYNLYKVAPLINFSHCPWLDQFMTCFLKVAYSLHYITIKFQLAWLRHHYIYPAKKKKHSPVRTALAEGSARSRADFPSVLRMLGSAPCWSSTVRETQAGVSIQRKGIEALHQQREGMDSLKAHWVNEYAERNYCKWACHCSNNTTLRS